MGTREPLGITSDVGLGSLESLQLRGDEVVLPIQSSATVDHCQIVCIQAGFGQKCDRTMAWRYENSIRRKGVALSANRGLT